MLNAIKKYGMTVLFSVQFGVLFYLVFDLKQQNEVQKQRIVVLTKEKLDKTDFVKLIRILIKEFQAVHEKIDAINDAIRIYDPDTGIPHKPIHNPKKQKINTKPTVRIYPYDIPRKPICPEQEGALFTCNPGQRPVLDPEV